MSSISSRRTFTPPRRASDIQETILVLEDDTALAMLVTSRLRRQGYVVETVTTADQAISLFSSLRIDLLIIDYNLGSQETGLDFYRRLREVGYSPPAILMTGLGDHFILIESLRLGVRDLLPKDAEFFDALPLVVERVIKDMQLERTLQDAQRNMRLQVELQNSLDATGMGYWSVNLRTGEFIWPYHLLSPTTATKHSQSSGTLEELLKVIHPQDRETVQNSFLNRIGANFEIEFRTSERDNSIRWYRLKGGADGPSDNPTRISGVLWDETLKHRNEEKLSKTLVETEQLAQRLRLNMMETHHRVKNGFQIVRSLLNMELRKAGTLDATAAKKVIAYLQGLATIHDILTENVRSDELSASVSCPELVKRLVDTLREADAGRDISFQIDDCHVTARIASTIAVVVTELLMNALKYGQDAIKISILYKSDGRGQFELENAVFPTTQASNLVSSAATRRTGTGLELVKFLVKNDLDSDFVAQQSGEGQFFTSFSFPTISSQQDGDFLTLAQP